MNKTDLLINQVEIKELYIFGDYAYFSYRNWDKITYFKTKKYNLLILNISEIIDFNIRMEMNFELVAESKLIEMNRGNYYDEIKKNFNEYCNYEVSQRLKENKNEN